jgi:hypothetical protein
MIPPGSRVAYAKAWVRNVGYGPTSPAAHARGTLTGYEGPFARIAWEKDYPGPDLVHPANLAIVGPNRAFCEDPPYCGPLPGRRR